MKTMYSILVFIGLFGIACTPNLDKAYIKSLKSTLLPDTQLEISIPDKYIIQKNMGPDYDIFYILPMDTNKKELLTAGIYLGNHPSNFGKSKSSCKESKRKTTIFGDENEWNVYHCNETYFIEMVLQNKYSSGGDEFLHLFGNANNKEDMEHLIAIFSTLNWSKK